MIALPERGVWHSFTDAELERLGVNYGIMWEFMRAVLIGVCEEYGCPVWRMRRHDQ